MGADQLAATAITNDDLGIASKIESTASNATDLKGIAAVCPAGTTVISGSVAVVHSAGAPPPDDVAISHNGLAPFLNGWYGAAFEANAVATNWSLQVVAICIRD